VSDDKPKRPREPNLSDLGRAPARVTVAPPPHEQADEPGFVRRWIRGALFDNLGLKFLSMVLAVTVFLLVNTDRERETSARIGVSYQLPDGMVLADRVDEVRVLLKGSFRRLRNFDETKLDRINLDLTHQPPGDIPITPDMIHLPSGLTIESISPRTIHVAFTQSVERTLELAPQIAGRPQHGYAVSEVKAVPATIKVRGAEKTLAALPSLRAREVSVENRTESFTAETDAVAPEGVTIDGSPQVVIRVTIDEELVQRKLPGLPVSVRGEGVDPARWTVTPAQIDVQLTGPLLGVEDAKATVAPMVKLSASDSKARDVDVTVEGVKPGIGVKLSPERVKVTPVKPAPPTP
jgi:YbbR domain-containing protein